MFNLSCILYNSLLRFTSRIESRIDENETGQATAEYVLVLLMASVVAFVVTQMFAKKGGGNPITSVVGSLLGKLTGWAGAALKGLF